METWTDRIGRIAGQHEVLGSTGGYPARCYALVDMRGYPDISRVLWEDASVPTWRLWEGTDLECHGDISPMLVEIDVAAVRAPEEHAGKPRMAATSALRCLSQIDQTSQGGYAITCMLSPSDGETLAQHYRAYCEYSLPDGRAYYLHFYDSRILERLMKVWDVRQKALFMSPVYEFHYRQRDGSIVTLESDPKVEAERAHSPDTPILDSRQHEMLLEEDYPDKVLLQLRRHVPDALSGCTDEDAYRRIVVQVDRARRHGLSTERDHFDYVAFALTTSDRFDEHPDVLACLLDARSRRIPVAEAFSALSDEVWDDIARTS